MVLKYIMVSSIYEISIMYVRGVKIFTNVKYRNVYNVVIVCVLNVMY